MKFLRQFADDSEDMDPTELGKTSSLSLKANPSRDQIVASDASRVGAWVDALLCAVGARRTHALDDSALRKIDTDLEVATRSCLDQIGDFAIRVEEFDLSFEGACIYHSTTQESSLSVALFEDGLREIVIRVGVEPDELRVFVDILERATSGFSRDSEDIVALLWEGDFRHVDHVCVPFEEWDPDPGTQNDERESDGADGGTSRLAEVPAMGGTGSDLVGCTEERFDDWSLRVEAEAVLNETLPSQFDLTETEVQNICMLARIEDGLSSRDRILEILLSILSAEENPAEFLEVGSSLGRLVEHAVAEGDMEGANCLVDRLRSVSGAKTTRPSEFQSATDQILQHIGRSDFLGRLGEVLGRCRNINLGELTKFLAQLGPSAAPTLCGVLGEIEEMKFRRAICEALVISCKNHVDLLIERLSDSRWYVVRNILYILGRIGHQGVERALADALYHGDERVRKEAVRALGGIDSPTSRAYVNSALRDSDMSIRILVVQLLARRKCERAARIIWGEIESPEFLGREIDERVAFCEALGRTGSDTLIPKMEQRLIRKGQVQSLDQEGRMEAAIALAWLGTPAALAVLSREERSRHDAVRNAVRDALVIVRKSILKNQRKG